MTGTPGAATWAPRAPQLDRDGEVWLGELPGLGSVQITADGGVTVQVSDHGQVASPEQHALRERALRYGWGEPLSWVRRGWRLANGAAVGPPGGDQCLVLLGDPHDVAVVLLDLAQQEWEALGDRPVPLRWDDNVLVAHPRESPIIVAQRRAAKAAVSGVAIRDETDAVEVQVPRARHPRRVSAVISMHMRKPDEAPLEPLTGHERFEAAAGLFMGGALTLPAPPAPSGGSNECDSLDLESSSQVTDAAEASERLAEHLRLASLPWARLRLDTKTHIDDTEAVLTWWSTALEAS